MLCLLGGLIGALVGSGGATAMSKFFQWNTIISPTRDRRWRSCSRPSSAWCSASGRPAARRVWIRSWRCGTSSGGPRGSGCRGARTASGGMASRGRRRICAPRPRCPALPHQREVERQLRRACAPSGLPPRRARSDSVAARRAPTARTAGRVASTTRRVLISALPSVSTTNWTATRPPTPRSRSDAGNSG